MKKKVIVNSIVLLVILILLYLVQSLLMPKYMTSIREGNLIAEYYSEKKDHDVIFIGDCEVYSNISPVTLWENYGITSYIRGSAEQLIWQSYYLLEETLTYEKPDVVVFNVLSMKSDTPHKEEYNRLTLDGMRFSASKINAVKASMMDDEEPITYLFPILRYHSRWSELQAEDFKYLMCRDKVSHNGFLMRADIKPVNYVPKGDALPDYRFSDTCYDYLDRMTKLCKDNGIRFILMKAPSVFPYWYEQWDEQMVHYAKENEIEYINFLNLSEETGIDNSTDTYDGGLHLNLSGAEKLTRYFGKILSEKYGIGDRRNDAQLNEIWESKKEFYYDMKQKQEEELMEYGYLKSFGAKPETIDEEN
ncbi:MAG: SGNH/GDSL hydrolase family protein [Eubacteriales bacterium]|nr:SGNH/GDSL hydrolase family protein [Eubacteriales bacterium]MDD4421774.1 SGNH/GDSL hydrolase family protein [Eubacteriales bacterium]